MDGAPVCFMHGLQIAAVVEEYVPLYFMDALRGDGGVRKPEGGDDRPRALPPPPRPQRFPRPAFVCYLMLNPTTVKIGTTRYLEQRIANQGGELQYVVALERGSYELERKRHDQFPMERHGVKEVFTISDALRQHIETLVPHRDELMKIALRT